MSNPTNDSRDGERSTHERGRVDMVDGPDTAERHRKLVREYYESFCTFDPAQYEHLVEADAYYEVGHNQYHGHEGFRTVAKMARFLYPNGLQMEIKDMIVEGNKVATRITTRAVTNKGEDYENYYAVHFLISDDGRIAELYEFTDTAYAHQKFSYDGFEAMLAS